MDPQLEFLTFYISWLMSFMPRGIKPNKTSHPNKSNSFLVNKVNFIISDDSSVEGKIQERTEPNTHLIQEAQVIKSPI